MGEYAVLKSWDSALEDFSIVWEFNEFGVGWSQEGKNYINYDALVWDAFFYKAGNGYYIYGYWFTYDFETFEYYDYDGKYCLGKLNISSISITDKFGSCPYVATGWDNPKLIFGAYGSPTSMMGPDGEIWDFYSDDVAMD